MEDMKSGFTKLQINVSLLILRLSLGGMMLTHGYPKLQRLISGDLQFADPIGIGSATSLYLAVFAEFFCSIFVMTGFFTRISSFFLAFTMFVAAIIQHGDDPFSKKEKALLYLFGFIVLIISGGGRLSIDKKINSKT